MESNWTKNELVAYILLYAAQSDLLESNKERNVILSKVDMKTFDKIQFHFCFLFQVPFQQYFQFLPDWKFFL